MLSNLTGWHALIILAVILLLFGAAKLPALAKSVGQSMKIFKSEVKSGQQDDVVPTTVPAERTAAAPAEHREGTTTVNPANTDPKP